MIVCKRSCLLVQQWQCAWSGAGATSIWGGLLCKLQPNFSLCNFSPLAFGWKFFIVVMKREARECEAAAPPPPPPFNAMWNLLFSVSPCASLTRQFPFVFLFALSNKTPTSSFSYYTTPEKKNYIIHSFNKLSSIRINF